MSAKQLVYISGSGHSGSTLLDMLLGGHQQIASLGEIHRLCMSARETTKVHLCACGRPISQCPFWLKVAEELQVLLGVRDPHILEHHLTTEPRNLTIEADDEEYLVRRAVPTSNRSRFNLNSLAMIVGSKTLWSLLARFSNDTKTYRTIISNSLLLYDATRRACNTPIIVDSTKNPIRLKGLYLAAQESFRVFYLLRDGRAVCYSRMRRQNLPMEKCARIWRMEHWRQRLIQRHIPQSDITRIHYENLCTQPKQELLRLCSILGIDYQESMLEFRHERHNIGGNPMRMRSSEGQIRLDERWRSELSTTDLESFERIAGPLNRQLGYTS